MVACLLGLATAASMGLAWVVLGRDRTCPCGVVWPWEQPGTAVWAAPEGAAHTAV